MDPNPLLRLNQALEYIEASLNEEPDLRRAAQIAGCSEYQFSRLFSFLAGASLSEYIRARRLSLAALELQQDGVKVIDLALKYGYTSPDAFARAFQRLHGIAPAAARKPGAALKSVPRLTFQLTLRGGTLMDYRIIEKEAFAIAGIHRRVRLQYEGVNPEISALWTSLTPEDIADLKQRSSAEPRGLISASTGFDDRLQEGSSLDQWVGAVVAATADAGRWDLLPVAAGWWAVFSVAGEFPQALQNVWGRIYSEWLPGSGYELVPGPEMLWTEGPHTEKPDYKSEIWIPVRKL